MSNVASMRQIVGVVVDQAKRWADDEPGSTGALLGALAALKDAEDRADPVDHIDPCPVCNQPVSEIVQLREALVACMACLPLLEVRNWPPGWGLKKTAIELANKALGR